MSVQLIPELYRLLPNSLTIGFTFFCVLVFAVGAAFIQRYKYVKRCEKIPGPPAQIPLFGSITEMLVGPENLLRHFMTVYQKWNRNSVMRLWIGPLALFTIAGADSVEVVLSSNKIIDKSREYNFLHPWLATGLLTSTGSKWHSRRKMLTPTFHFKILEDFVQVFNEQSSILVDKLNQMINKESQGFDIFPFITRCTLDVICETAMGRHVNAQDKSDSEYVKAVYQNKIMYLNTALGKFVFFYTNYNYVRMSRIVQKRQVEPWLQIDWLFHMSPNGSEHKKCLSILHGFTDQMIRERKIEHKLRKSQKEEKDVSKKDDDTFIFKKPRLAFLDLLIEASQDGKVLSDLDIREEVDTFMFEGHDTTSAAISWSLFLIGSHPKVQEQVNDELNRVFGDSDRPVTMADLSELKYLECCIKEALRLYPSVPALARQLGEDTKIGEYELPKGSTVAVMIYLLHRDPKYFPDPESYQPERFFPENSHGRHPYAYVPFSAGPRNCIGQKFALMEEKIILSSILRHFHIKALDKPTDLVLLTELILRPRDGIRLSMTQKSKIYSKT